MTSWTLREVVELELEDEITETLRPEQLLLSWPSPRTNHRRFMDIGAICYLKRSRLSEIRNNSDRRRPVLLESLDTSRRDIVSRYSDYLRTQWSLHKRATTIETKLRNALQYVDFCDAISGPEILPLLKPESLAAYIHWLEHRTSLSLHQENYLRLSTAVSYQNCAIQFISSSTGKDRNEITAGIRLIRGGSRSFISTADPDKDRLSQALKCHYTLFTGLSELVLENRPLPFLLQMPDQKLFCLPDRTCYIASRQARLMRKTKNVTFDYEKGRLYSKQEVVKSIKPRSSGWHHRQQSLLRAQNALDRVNSDFRCPERVVFAQIACQAFYMLFIANTGLNDQPARDIRWDENCELNTGKSGWCLLSIKNRGSIEIQAEIGEKFKRSFDQYIRLRAWLVNGRQAERLFVCQRQDGTLEPFDDSRIQNYRLRLKASYPEIPWVTARELRKHKGLYVLRKSNGSIEIAAQILGNTTSTVERHYSEGSTTSAADDFAALWNSVRKRKIESLRINNAIPAPVPILNDDQKYFDTPIGHCEDYQHPSRSKEFTEQALSPDCLRSESCLFCCHFAVHADEHDIRKLISCKYLLSSLRPAFDHEEHFLSEYGTTIARIEEVINQIREISEQKSDLVALINREVHKEGLLSPYWQRRLDMLVDMGVDLEGAL